MCAPGEGMGGLVEVGEALTALTLLKMKTHRPQWPQSAVKCSAWPDPMWAGNSASSRMEAPDPWAQALAPWGGHPYCERWLPLQEAQGLPLFWDILLFPARTILGPPGLRKPGWLHRAIGGQLLAGTADDSSSPPSRSHSPSHGAPTRLCMWIYGEHGPEGLLLPGRWFWSENKTALGLGGGAPWRKGRLGQMQPRLC